MGLETRKSKIWSWIREYPFWPYIAKYRKRYALGLLALIVVDLINVLFPLVLKEAIDSIEAKNFSHVLLFSLSYLALTALQGIGRYLWRTYLTGTSHFIASDLRVELNENLQRLPQKNYQEYRTGDLMSRATNDVESIRMAVGPGILVALDSLFLFIMIVPVMFWMSVKLSLLAFALYPLVPPITYFLGNRIDKLFESLQTKMSHMGAFAQECFSGIRVLKALVLENRSTDRFKELSLHYQVEAQNLSKYEAVFSPTLMLITNMGTLLILMYGGLDVLGGVITLGTFIAFQRFVVQLSWPMEAIGWSVTMNREGFAAKRRIDEILNVEKVREAYPSQASIQTNALLKFGEIEVLPHEKVGLVGKVGSGKSTLFLWMMRLIEPKTGTVFLSGQDVLSIPLKTLRKRIAMVEQQVFLFGETISYNLSIGLSPGPTTIEIQKACETACIADDINALEKKYDAVLGERGLNLSGGQKQRLALARSLLRNPELLLLDDCFSAVDVEVESKIIEKLLKNYPRLTTLIVSHRLSIMKNCNKVYVLDAGLVTGQGKHEELLGTSPLYHELFQLSERTIEKEAFEKKLEDLSL